MKKTVVLLFTMLLLANIVACGQNAETTWQEQYDLGVRYLSDGNYEEAIIAFTAAIEIDPKRPEAYADLARTYVAVGKTEQAIFIIEQGATAVGESEILDRVLEELGLSPLQEAEQIPSDSLNEMSFTDITIEEIMSVLPSLVQGEIVRSEQGELTVTNELTAYSQFKEYDREDRIVRETSYNADGTVYYVENRYYDVNNNQLRVYDFGADNFYQVYSVQGKLLLNYRITKDASGREEVVSHFIYRYSGNQVHILLNVYWAPDRWTAEADYTMASSDNRIEVPNWGRSDDDVFFDVYEVGSDAYTAESTITVKGTFY